MSATRRLTVWLIVLAACGSAACSRSPPESTVESVSSKQAGDSAALYDSASLVEIKHFTDLPNDLREAIRAGKVPTGHNISDRDMGGERIFTIAGVSKSSALVGYAKEGPSPEGGATAFVLQSSGWVKAKEWGNEVSSAHTLSQLVFITNYLSKDPPIQSPRSQ
jgi:hypothetical protein